ncbi:hypothetical protein QW060_17955 [Myroides ceti]|uniref:Uncharacterized protein n=1 Tax=Paenimyroides ceti TaxID=395087 RepID=A0ABT8CWR7_9FLAO|nr:hypothetical protein [Paenimyroides ceti]MDN3708962.1 hypothetical protein [Paenimyroides ceti]
MDKKYYKYVNTLLVIVPMTLIMAFVGYPKLWFWRRMVSEILKNFDSPKLSVIFDTLHPKNSMETIIETERLLIRKIDISDKRYVFCWF